MTIQRLMQNQLLLGQDPQSWNRILFCVLNNILFQFLRKPAAKPKFTMLHPAEIHYNMSLRGIITKHYLHLNLYNL